MKQEQITTSANLDQQQMQVRSDQSFFTVLATTFGTVFLAELGDKTQVATLLLSAHSGKPLTVFIGAASALILSSFIGVILGRWISKKMPEEAFQYLAGILMIILGLWLGVQASISVMTNLR